MGKKYKKVRDRRLAVAPPVNRPEIAKKAVLADEPNYDGSKINGRKSLIEKMKVQGIYLNVLAETMDIRCKNPDMSFEKLYHHLRGLYPLIFDNENIVGSNFKKTVESDELWCNCFYACKDSIDKMINLQMFMLLRRENLKEETVLKSYDLLLKKQQFDKQLEQSNSKADMSIVVEINGSVEEGDDVCMLD